MMPAKLIKTDLVLVQCNAMILIPAACIIDGKGKRYRNILLFPLDPGLGRPRVTNFSKCRDAFFNIKMLFY